MANTTFNMRSIGVESPNCRDNDATETFDFQSCHQSDKSDPYWHRHTPKLHISEYWQQFEPRSDTEHEILGCLVILLGILSICGNGCVLYVFTRTKTLRTPSNALIVNLALSDFLMMSTQCPICVINSFHHRWALPAFWCPFMAFTGALFGLASIMSMTVIAIGGFSLQSPPQNGDRIFYTEPIYTDRYLVICGTLPAHQNRMSPLRARRAIAFVWLYSLAWSLPPLFGVSRYVPEGLLTSCSFDYLDESLISRLFVLAMGVGAYFAPLTVVVVCYVPIYLKVRRSERTFALELVKDRRTAGSLTGKTLRKARKKQRKEVRLAKIIVMVITCWATSWAPYLVVSLAAVLFSRSFLTPWSSQAPAMFAKSGSVYNPFVYAISHSKYREAVRQHFPFLICFPTKEVTLKKKTTNNKSVLIKLLPVLPLGNNVALPACKSAPLTAAPI